MVPTPIIPGGEAKRLDAVGRYALLDSPAEPVFDRIAMLAARRFNAPIALISIVDRDRVWFKARQGLGVGQLDRDPGLCASAILGQGPYIVPDASADPRALGNPLITGPTAVRFYAGVPLTTRDGDNLGTLCIMDTRPRSFSDQDLAELVDLAAIVMDAIELRFVALNAVADCAMAAQEVDHRVMNSLQFIAGLLTLQSRDVADGGASMALKDAAARVSSVAQIHRSFYSDGEGVISSTAFVDRLGRDLGSVLDRRIRVKGDDAPIAAAQLHPLGLIVNELVTNAAKHGAGVIDIRCGTEGDRHVVTVSDEGRGLPPGFDPGTSSRSLGMRVVSRLVQQLDGELATGNRAGGGAYFRLSFPAMNRSEPSCSPGETMVLPCATGLSGSGVRVWRAGRGFGGIERISP